MKRYIASFTTLFFERICTDRREVGSIHGGNLCLRAKPGRNLAQFTGELRHATSRMRAPIYCCIERYVSYVLSLKTQRTHSLDSSGHSSAQNMYHGHGGGERLHTEIMVHDYDGVFILTIRPYNSSHYHPLCTGAPPSWSSRLRSH